MISEIVENTYVNGQRICMQKIIYDKSDDLFKLANLQRQYELVCAKLMEKADAGATETEALENEKIRLEASIVETKDIISRYDAE